MERARHQTDSLAAVNLVKDFGEQFVDAGPPAQHTRQRPWQRQCLQLVLLAPVVAATGEIWGTTAPGEGQGLDAGFCWRVHAAAE